MTIDRQIMMRASKNDATLVELNRSVGPGNNTGPVTDADINDFLSIMQVNNHITAFSFSGAHLTLNSINALANMISKKLFITRVDLSQVTIGEPGTQDALHGALAIAKALAKNPNIVSCNLSEIVTTEQDKKTLLHALEESLIDAPHTNENNPGVMQHGNSNILYVFPAKLSEKDPRKSELETLCARNRDQALLLIGGMLKDIKPPRLLEQESPAINAGYHYLKNDALSEKVKKSLSKGTSILPPLRSRADFFRTIRTRLPAITLLAHDKLGLNDTEMGLLLFQIQARAKEAGVKILFPEQFIAVLPPAQQQEVRNNNAVGRIF